MVGIKEVKELGWSYIQLSTQGYGGAVKQYTGSNGNVAVAFNTCHAYVVEDNQGLFGVTDLREGVIKEPTINPEFLVNIVGATSIVFWNGVEPVKNEQKLASLGLTDSKILSDITLRLQKLHKLHELVEVSL